jgi:nucleoside-diphosphate-sugar epimerase
VSAGHPTFTVLGAAGFIGTALVAWLRRSGEQVRAVTRASLPELLASRSRAGHVIDCIGLTADYRTRPLETAEAHVGVVARCLAGLRLESFLLLSSTRVYARADAAHEDAPLAVVPSDSSDLYNLSKLAGEALCLADPRPSLRVARLSNTYDEGMPAQTFLGEVLREGQATGEVVFRQGAGSAKDYVSLTAVVRLLPMIATAGRRRLYNVAAGVNTSHAAIARCLHDVAGWSCEFAPGAPTIVQPRIDITRLNAEFGTTDSHLLADLPALLSAIRDATC